MKDNNPVSNTTKCHRCGGAGRLRIDEPESNGGQISAVCDRCGGSGRTSQTTAKVCRKCGAGGTHHCSMPGCPLPPLKDTEAQSNTTAVFSVDPDTEELLYGGIKLAYLHPIYSLYRIAHEQNFGVSALSWNGFNLMGDRRSIDEVRRLMFCEARMKALEERLNAKS